MDKYPIFPVDGGEFVKEDLEDGWKTAGVAGDKVRAQLAQVPVASGDRVGYCVPAVDGPLVVPNGASGTVKVQPFTAYRSPNGSETRQELITGYFDGSVETVPTPLPTAGNHNWYLLYAIVAETDSDAESRLSEDPTTEDIGAGTVNTRHKATVTLAWVQGTQAAQATNPYPAGNWPALPAPLAGMAHVPLAHVHVEDDGTPATVTYDVDRIANAPQLAPFNPQTGAASVVGTGLSWAGDVGGLLLNTADVKAIATSSDAYRWPQVSGGHRPKTFIEQQGGNFSLWIPIDLYGSTLVGTNWTVFKGPIFDSTSSVPGVNAAIDWKNRWFMGRLQLSRGGQAFSHAPIAFSSSRKFPTRVPESGGAAPIACFGAGQTMLSDPDFDGMTGITAGDWYVACYFPDVTGAGHLSDVALLIRKSASGSGFVKNAMYFAAREGTSGDIDDRQMLIKLDVSGQVFPIGT